MDRGSIWSVFDADGALSCRDQEREPRDDQKVWDSPMAEAVAFLISGLASLQKVSGESSSDPHAERILGSVAGKVVEALSALDYLSVTQWIRSGSTSTSAEAIPIMGRGENRMTGCRMGACWSAGGSADRARRVTHQHAPWGSKRPAPSSPINFSDSE
jgi:hypothetical protein